jgi:hypothetical protein
MDNLPRLLVISDVGVELTSAGSTLLYRLFETYPKEKLCIVQSTVPQKDRTLTSVKYRQLRPPNFIVKRLSKTRLYPIASFFEYIGVKTINTQVIKTVETFKPDAIISVTFRFAWLLAYAVAKKYELPLHLILHDDIITAEKHGDLLATFIKKDFKKIYQFAASRFCISPNMERMYRETIGVEGQVIYPTLGKNDVAFDVAERIKVARKNLRFCYAGSLYTPDFPEMLDQLAGILQEKGHTLIVFSEARKEDLKDYSYLQAEHVEFRQFVHPAVLREFMITQADVNVLLNSFLLEEPFRWNFSSKLVEYTVVALPVLLWGPQSSGAIDWAVKNTYEGVLCEKSADKLSQLVDRFIDTDKRALMANHLRKIGLETFGHEKNYTVFINKIVGQQLVRTKTFDYTNA